MRWLSTGGHGYILALYLTAGKATGVQGRLTIWANLVICWHILGPGQPIALTEFLLLLPSFQKYFAFAEGLAHLEYLKSLGKVREKKLADGNIVYSLV